MCDRCGCDDNETPCDGCSMVESMIKKTKQPKQYLFPFKVQQWATIQTEDGNSLCPGRGMRAIGFIPVYESIVELVDDHGNEIACGTFEAMETSDGKA